MADTQRPKRRRVAPTRLAEEVATPEEKPQNKARKQPARKSGKKDIWTEEYLTQNPKSPVASADLVRLFSQPAAWELLDEEEKRILMSLLPDRALTDDQSGVRPEFLKHDIDFKTGIRLYQEDLEAGRYDPEWLQQAAVAMEERAQGKFDAWKEQEYEAFWGQKQALSHDVVAGASSKMKLDAMVREGQFKVGDIWAYRRLVCGVLVEKEVRVVGFGPKKTMEFSIPPGQHKFSSPQQGPDVILKGVVGPTMLANEILRVDGRVEKPPNGNGWKEFRCKRDNQDMGSIWEMRQALHYKMGGD
ncbi:hypothetical protein L228DRAFT_262406 [Xylona heveae TC161]|uniref:DEUBAD domain-containing protein n=1 Tax=Xylona heveae (strain CBS 132557 / TC161) TaxID=1328760 RepID=A0A165FU51_XYLHT|nr:hypothetical protein L228DRAFT_262406 [Xylona heveae TC161]KZF21384.1 hypothetical protein L228DRAFT_262406 [Xylona heveae TC161]